MTAIKSFHPLVIVSKFFFSFSHSSTIFILGIGMCTQLFWDINFSIQRTSPKLDSPYHPKFFDFFFLLNNILKLLYTGQNRISKITAAI